MALTDVMIRRAKPKEKAYRISDGGSMFLRVTPAGGKLWRWAYLYEGKEKLMSFGGYPDVSLAMARERHSGARRSLVAGVDPWPSGRPRRPLSKSRARTHSLV
jgi:hypothetical protein